MEQEQNIQIQEKSQLKESQDTNSQIENSNNTIHENNNSSGIDFQAKKQSSKTLLQFRNDSDKDTLCISGQDGFRLYDINNFFGYSSDVIKREYNSEDFEIQSLQQYSQEQNIDSWAMKLISLCENKLAFVMDCQPYCIHVWDMAADCIYKTIKLAGKVRQVLICEENLLFILQENMRLMIYDIEKGEPKLYRNKVVDFNVCSIKKIDKQKLIGFSFIILNDGGKHTLFYYNYDLNQETQMDFSKYKGMEFYTIQKIQLSSDGLYLAAVSEQGKEILMFDTRTGKIVNSFWRGSSAKIIGDLKFSPDSTVLVVIAYNKNWYNIANYQIDDTLHIFFIQPPTQDKNNNNQKIQSQIKYDINLFINQAKEKLGHQILLQYQEQLQQPQSVTYNSYKQQIRLLGPLIVFNEQNQQDFSGYYEFCLISEAGFFIQEKFCKSDFGRKKIQSGKTQYWMLMKKQQQKPLNLEGSEEDQSIIIYELE